MPLLTASNKYLYHPGYTRHLLSYDIKNGAQNKKFGELVCLHSVCFGLSRYLDYF